MVDDTIDGYTDRTIIDVLIDVRVEMGVRIGVEIVDDLCIGIVDDPLGVSYSIFRPFQSISAHLMRGLGSSSAVSFNPRFSAIPWPYVHRRRGRRRRC